MTDRPLELQEVAEPGLERVCQLRTAELFALAAARLWVADFIGKAGEVPSWRRGFVAADLDEGAETAFDQLFQAFAGGATRQIEFHCPNCPRLSADELQYLRALALLQRDLRAPAEAILADWLAPAARRVALNVAHAVAGSIAVAGLVLPWRDAVIAVPHGAIHYADQWVRLIH